MTHGVNILKPGWETVARKLLAFAIAAIVVMIVIGLLGHILGFIWTILKGIFWIAVGILFWGWVIVRLIDKFGGGEQEREQAKRAEETQKEKQRFEDYRNREYGPETVVGKVIRTVHDMPTNLWQLEKYEYRHEDAGYYWQLSSQTENGTRIMVTAQHYIEMHSDGFPGAAGTSYKTFVNQEEVEGFQFGMYYFPETKDRLEKIVEANVNRAKQARDERISDALG